MQQAKRCGLLRPRFISDRELRYQTGIRINDNGDNGDNSNAKGCRTVAILEVTIGGEFDAQNAIIA